MVSYGEPVLLYGTLWCHPFRMDTTERLTVLGFNDTSTLVGHFVSSPREREKRPERGRKEIKEIVEEMKD